MDITEKTEGKTKCIIPTLYKEKSPFEEKNNSSKICFYYAIIL